MKIKKQGPSKHHLFTYHEVRARLVEVFGQPVSDEDHRFLHKEIRKFRNKMPLYGLSYDRHKEIHSQEGRS